jgi:hypothetical protein
VARAYIRSKKMGHEGFTPHFTQKFANPME